MVQHTPQHWREWLKQVVLAAGLMLAHLGTVLLFSALATEQHLHSLMMGKSLLALGLVGTALITWGLHATRIVSLSPSAWKRPAFRRRVLELAVVFLLVIFLQDEAVRHGDPADVVVSARGFLPIVVMFAEYYFVTKRLRRVHVLPLYLLLSATVLEVRVLRVHTRRVCRCAHRLPPLTRPARPRVHQVPRLTEPFVGEDSTLIGFACVVGMLALEVLFLTLVARSFSADGYGDLPNADLFFMFSAVAGAGLLAYEAALGDLTSLGALQARHSDALVLLGVLLLVLTIGCRLALKIWTVCSASALSAQLVVAVPPVLLHLYQWTDAVFAPVLMLCSALALVAASTPRVSLRSPERVNADAAAAPGRLRAAELALWCVVAANIVFTVVKLVVEGSQLNVLGLVALDALVFTAPILYLTLAYITKGRSLETALQAALAIVMANYVLFPPGMADLLALALLLLRAAIVYVLAGGVQAAHDVAETAGGLDGLKPQPMAMA